MTQRLEALPSASNNEVRILLDELGRGARELGGGEAVFEISVAPRSISAVI